MRFTVRIKEVSGTSEPAIRTEEKKYIICTRISFLRHVASKSEIGTTSNQNTLAQDTRNFFKDAVGTNLSVVHPQPMAWGEAKPKRQIDV